MLALASISVSAAPFPSADQNPLLAGHSFIAPARLEPKGQTSAQLSLDWSSTSALQQSGNESLVVDAESQAWRFQIEHAINDKISVRLQIPFRKTSAGSLDSAIESWHDFFGLPNGDRTSMPRDRLHIEYRQGATTSLTLNDTSYSALGDVALDLGYQLRSTESSATSVWSSIYLPTGDPDNLSGTGTFSGALAIAHTMNLGERFMAFGHVGMHFGDSSGVLTERNKSSMWLAMIGFDFKATGKLTLTLQFDAHDAAFEDSGLGLLSPAYILTVGGDYALPSQWRLQFGVGEDIKVEASPDVTFAMNVAKHWK
jgi:hypothetical protein